MMNRLTIGLVAALFALPVVLSVTLYGLGWRPARTMNHGELIEPARAIADTELQTLDGARLRFSNLHGKWALIYFGSAACQTVCQRNLYKMRQVRLAQGENATRVERVFVILGAHAGDTLRATLAGYAGMQVITGPVTNVATLARQFALPIGTPLDGLERIYVIDPLGRLMMSYPPDADPSGIRKDLTRLLRVSRIG
jgi:cytochrome oxidase Cu insertion factor (SCO1/SenC/PrrC family)